VVAVQVQMERGQITLHVKASQLHRDLVAQVAVVRVVNAKIMA
jgi:hypothetical protein